ncbi:hypothetical protein M758_2G198700 [Ceratodon purpureus]|nr:hypothetical protein M758_2G198700 [Ceratodon purpureus]
MCSMWMQLHQPLLQLAACARSSGGSWDMRAAEAALGCISCYCFEGSPSFR